MEKCVLTGLGDGGGADERGATGFMEGALQRAPPRMGYHWQFRIVGHTLGELNKREIQVRSAPKVISTIAEKFVQTVFMFLLQQSKLQAL